MLRRLILLLVAILLSGQGMAAMREFQLTDYLRHDWTGEVVHFPVTFQRGECDGTHLALTQGWDGQPAPCQLIEAKRYADGSVQQARLTFLCDLPAAHTRTWRLECDHKAAPPATTLTVTRAKETIILSSGSIALRMPAGERRYRHPIAAAEAPAPLLGVQGPDGIWRGSGRLESTEKVSSYQAELVEDGPVLKEYRIAYRFTNDKSYQVTIRLYSGQPYAHICEDANVDKTSRFVFSAYTGFAPTHWVSPYQVTGLSYLNNRRLLRFFFNTYFHQVFDFKDWIALFRDDPASKDYLTFVKVHGGTWTSPLHNAIAFEEQTGPDLCLQATLRPSRREWLVAMFDRTQLKDSGKSYPQPDILQHLCAKVGFTPLDVVKEQILAWPLAPQERAVTAEERAIAQRLLSGLTALVNSSIVDGPYNENHALGYGQRIDFWRLYPRVAGSGALSAADERYVRAALAFLAYQAMARDYFAWYLPLLPHEDTSDAEEPLQNWKYNFYMMNTNFDACRFCGIGEIALGLRDHPAFNTFLDHYQQCLRLHLDNTFSEDGYYHESISYMCWDLTILTMTAERMQRELGIDSFAEPRLQKAYWRLVELVTPPDPRYAGAPRALPHFGSHDPMGGLQGSWGHTLALAADAYTERDPALAGALAWLWQQLGCTGVPPRVAPRQPALHSARIRGWGAVMRPNFGSAHESYVLYRCDPFVGRYLNEENSFYLFAKGRPLLLTPHDGFEGHETFDTLTENKISFNGVSNYEQFCGQLGTLEAFHSLYIYDYVRGMTQGEQYQREGMKWSEYFKDKPHTHRRHFLSVGGDYFVMTDEVKCDYPSDFTLQVLADRAEQQGTVVHCSGRYDVDLDVHLLAPRTPVEVTHTRMLTSAQSQPLLPMLRLHAVAPPNQPYFTVLAPYVRGQETPPVVEQLGEQFAVHVTQGAREDYVFLSPGDTRWQSGGLQFIGTRGILRVRPRVELVLLETGAIGVNDFSLQSTAGGIALVAQADGSWEGRCDGDAKDITINGAPVDAVLLDDQPLKWAATPGGVKFTVPAGVHTVRLR